MSASSNLTPDSLLVESIIPLGQIFTTIILSMLRIINFDDTPTVDPSSDNFKFPSSSGLPILELETPFSKERLCKYCRLGGTALNHLIWACCCDGYNRFAHASCLKDMMFRSITAVTATRNADVDHEAWRRCADCCVDYRIEYDTHSKVSCEKMKYNLSEHTAYVLLTTLVMVILGTGLVVLVLIFTKTWQVTPEHTNSLEIGLTAGIVVQCVVIFAMLIVYFKAFFVLPELSVAKIYGID